MRRNVIRVVAFAATLAITGCSDLFGPDYSEPNVPPAFQGRPVETQGTVTVSNRNVTFSVWDHGNLVDGDIISLVINGRTVVSEHTLTRTKHTVSVSLNPNGYSYVMLYAHNEGTSPPNTAGVSIDDGSGEQTFSLTADLETNGAYNIIVE